MCSIVPLNIVAVELMLLNVKALTASSDAGRTVRYENPRDHNKNQVNKNRGPPKSNPSSLRGRHVFYLRAMPLLETASEENHMLSSCVR